MKAGPGCARDGASGDRTLREETMDEKSFLFFHKPKFMQFFAVVFAVYWSLPALVQWWANRRQKSKFPDPKLPPPDTAQTGHSFQMTCLVIASCIFYMSAGA